MARAAFMTAARAFASKTSRSTSRCCTAWKLAMGTPKAMRSFRYATSRSKVADSAPSESALSRTLASASSRSACSGPPIRWPWDPESSTRHVARLTSNSSSSRLLGIASVTSNKWIPLRPRRTRMSMASPFVTRTVSPDSATPAVAVPSSIACNHRSRRSSGADDNAAADRTQPNHVDEFRARPSSSAMTVASTGRHPAPPRFSSTSNPVQSMAASSLTPECSPRSARNSRADWRRRSRSTSSSPIARLAPR